MFRNRTNSQKPADELLADFKVAYPGLSSNVTRTASVSNAAIAEPTSSAEESLQLAVSRAETVHVSEPMQRTEHNSEQEMKDMDPTPRANVDQWRFTPSLLDPDSFAFTSFANQPPGYYTPTPGGTNTIYHPQAGDLHTPGFTLGLGTPQSMPNSDSSRHLSQTAGQVFNPQALAPTVFQNPNPFDFGSQQQQTHHHGLPIQQSQTFAPHQFSHQQNYDQFPSLNDGKMDDFAPDVDMHDHNSGQTNGYLHQSIDAMISNATSGPHQNALTLENFRYHTTLNAPTAMVKSANDIPVTYLNKGQAYSIKMVDTRSSTSGSSLPTYRTFLRISFEDEQQRQRPAQCWQLWKEGRGTTEAHHRGGRLQAVEFVDPAASGGVDPALRPRIELESASFDGFAVRWSPPPHGPAECQVSVRFNFLSTDFSHSKGVKGIPVRLCAKTQLLTSDGGITGADAPEICYCKVKLFRDHGAERKLSNDIAHVKKTIDKLQQQIKQLETGIKDFGKRKRSDAGSKSIGALPSRPGKVPKHKRTWSMSSTSDTAKKPSVQEEELRAKLAALQDMFSSTQPASVLFLKGEQADDPDLSPVFLSAEPIQGLERTSTGDSGNWEKSSNQASDIVSPTPSQHTLGSQERLDLSFARPVPYQPSEDAEWLPQSAIGDLHQSPPRATPADVPMKVRTSRGDNTLASWIEALGVDHSYQAPPERPIKPVASMFIQPRMAGQAAKDNYYRAIYLMQRTLNDVVHGVAGKMDVEPSKILRTLRINAKGITIALADEDIVELAEGQDMIAELLPVKPSSPARREWDSGPNDIQVDGEVDTIQTLESQGYELRLVY